ncbi:proline dehydrogenase family protein [Mariniblastus fucicola]|uniref:L-glutamate gamma-semialdehyde dehydrogenase n=1 Tax=Mariniblastus fucicola TaxID=980251 RepID=A0A5B9PCN2_9BACT|nr:proline dehydrogenase family protein [Mariniblastus fucicola]QEG20861.1 Bifunctional protein PutA [Mariniblastus fucicola]
MQKTELDLLAVSEDAIKLAAEILEQSRKHESSAERQRSAMMARMMNDADGKKFTMAMADQVLRMIGTERAAKRMGTLIEEYGVPKYFSFVDRLAVRLGNRVAGWMPGFIMPKVTSKIRKDSAHVIISAAKDKFAKYLAQRKSSGMRVNFNQLGEAVLGDHEADRRLRDNISRMTEPGVNYISVKLSSICSQISLTGYEQTKEMIKPRLRELYRAAIGGVNEDQPKFVNLDMEEYRDLHLTVDIFKSVLDEPEFESMMAGIVLQAYLPDSFEVLQSLTQWARERHSRSGGRIKVRIVKGANLAMEQVDASMHDWPQAPYRSKLESDANFKRMLEFATRPENAKVVQIGIGSHNLFDIAFGLLLRERREVQSFVEFEMLEGMANAQATEVLQRSGDMLLYAPVVLDSEFEAAVAYLVRRLDENTAPGSFLGALFALEKGSQEWNRQAAAFREAVQLSQSDQLSSQPNRTQDRSRETFEVASPGSEFHNADDTDFSLPANREWASEIVRQWKDKSIEPIPICVGQQQILEPLTGEGHDPSKPDAIVYRYAEATAAHVENALNVAVEAQKNWEAQGLAHRSHILRQVAVEVAKGRAESIGSMLFEAGKAIQESDVEVSEAIDFANYYAGSLEAEGWFDGTQAKAIGVVVVTPPWNFPFAIPCGGVLAALMAGNSVILKPAGESVLTAWTMVNQLWRAGVPKDVLQFIPMEDGPVGKKLLSDPRVAAVVLTGSIQTAKLFQSWRPDLNLLAETSGKNCLVISSSADLDLAIKDLVKGAFGHAGQKCSASSLALVDDEVYDSPKFRQQLVDAASSLKVGVPWNAASIVTPVIREPGPELAKGLTELDAGEEWLLEPKIVDGNPCLWSPGIRIGVQPGSWYHRTECFGPVLGLIRVTTVEEAIEIQNSSEFGLTGGIHSLDPKEIDLWREKVEVGNAYINRPTTGAIVQRQPFGGWKNSCIGPGSKAGGPNYVSLFCEWTETESPQLRERTSQSITDFIKRACSDDDQQQERILAAAESMQYWWNREFAKSHDPSQIHGETNEFRYRNRPWHLVRVESVDESTSDAILKLGVACQTSKVKLMVSVDESCELAPLPDSFTDSWTRESSDEFGSGLTKLQFGSVTWLGEPPKDQVRAALVERNIPLSSRVLSNGRIELLKLLREQSVTETTHRYGNIV